MKKRKESSKETKKQTVLCGSLISPIAIGKSAQFFANGSIYCTSHVAVIHEVTTESVHFETMNTHYHLILSPYPMAAINPMEQAQAVCA